MINRTTIFNFINVINRARAVIIIARGLHVQHYIIMYALSQPAYCNKPATLLAAYNVVSLSFRFIGY